MAKPKKAPQKSGSNETAKAIASYLGCIGISLIVMYYFSGAAGILLATALTCAFMLSLAATLLAWRFVRIESQLDRTSAAKGEIVTCIVDVQTKMIIPSPMIELHIASTAQLSGDTEICRLSLAGDAVNRVKLNFTAKYFGAASVRINEAYICDYLGIFRFKLKNVGESMKINIFPNIPDSPVQTDFLRTAVLFSNSDDDDDETDETAMSQTGTPGYDHREYYAGDPIKRINWKLSSKRDIYMVRLDERTATSGQHFILDVPPVEENDISLAVRDTIAEGLLAVFTMIIREGREATVYYAGKDDWQINEIRTGADIYALQSALSSLEPCSPKDAVPKELKKEGKTPICFTAATSDSPDSAVRISTELPETVIVSSADSGLESLSAQGWTINRDFEIKKRH